MRSAGSTDLVARMPSLNKLMCYCNGYDDLLRFLAAYCPHLERIDLGGVQ